MPTVSEILAIKGSQVHCIPAGTTVLEATREMNERKIGAVVVREGREGAIVGIFTERDVLRRVVGERRDPATTLVDEVMTEKVMCCWPGTDLDEVSAIMRDKRIRHLPVCDEEGELVGMVSLGDLNAFCAKTQDATIHFLSEYIYGRV
jgi:IMP dehydrogenase